MLDESNWEPKKVFHAMAARYQRPEFHDHERKTPYARAFLS